MKTSITRRSFNLGALATAISPMAAHASEAPLRFIVPTAPASGMDLIARATQPILSRVLNRAVVIENPTGAGGVVGTTQLVRANPDGNTVGIISVNHIINALVYRKLPFDSMKDITPIIGLGTIPLVMLVNPEKTPVKNARELAELIRSRPEQLNYSSPGNGAAPHLAAQMFLDAAKVKAIHIPYKGTGPQVSAVISGDASFTIISASGAVSFIKAGTLRPVAVMSKQRLPGLPDVPTIVELGFPSAEAEAWFGIAGPVGLNPVVMERLRSGFATAFAQPELREAMDTQMNVIRLSTASEMTQLMQSDLARYKVVAQGIGLALD